MRLSMLFALAVVAMAAVTANAVDRTWTGATDNDWMTGSNWSPDAGGEPYFSDNLLIDSGTPEMSGWMKSGDGGKITIDGGDVMSYGQRIHIGYNNTWGNMDIKSGSLTMQYTGSESYPKFNVGDKGQGFVNQTGGDVSVLYPTNTGITGWQSTLQLAGANMEGIWYISGGTLTVGKLGNGWDGRGEFRVIGDDATITLTGETGPGSQAYWQNNRSKLIFEIGDKIDAANPGISPLDASDGIVNVGGTLEVSFTEIPTVGEIFTLIKYGTLGGHGNFDTYDLTVDSPLGVDTVDLALHKTANGGTEYQVEVLAIYGAIPGDLNDDGAVNSSDLDIVRGAWGQTVEAGCLPCGDPSGDGVVNSSDLDVVRANWGAGAAAAAVPEPAACSLLFAALALASIRRRRR